MCDRSSATSDRHLSRPFSDVTHARQQVEARQHLEVVIDGEGKRDGGGTAVAVDQLSRRARVEDSTGPHGHYSIAELLGLVELMGHEQHRRAIRTELFD